jgi:hypothetical protein
MTDGLVRDRLHGDLVTVPQPLGSRTREQDGFSRLLARTPARGGGRREVAEVPVEDAEVVVGSREYELAGVDVR